MATEKRLIDANALTEEYIKMQYYDQTMGIICNRYMPEIARVARQPTVDAVEVVHAEWVVCGDGDCVPFMCSHCGKTTAYHYKIMYGKYCPNCGAKMDGGKSNAQ